MSSVNKTENYGLSQFSANDQPTWIGDYSGDMQKIDTALGNSAKRTSDKFSESLPYAAGAYCIKDDLLYKFKSAKSAGAWDASKVQATTVMSEITGLTEKRKLIEKEFSSGNISITNNMTYELPYTVPDGYEYFSFAGAESYNVPTSIAYQGNTGNAISLYINCFNSGGNGSINMRLQFQRK